LDEIPNPTKRVDEDWKSQIEKERKSTAPQSQGPATKKSQEEVPSQKSHGQVNFALFLSTLAMQAYVAVGEMPDPQTNKKNENLQQAQYMIDVLSLIEEKTKGNLNQEEESMLSSILYELRMKFVEKKKAKS